MHSQNVLAHEKQHITVSYMHDALAATPGSRCAQASWDLRQSEFAICESGRGLTRFTITRNIPVNGLAPHSACTVQRIVQCCCTARTAQMAERCSAATPRSVAAVTIVLSSLPGKPCGGRGWRQQLAIACCPPEGPEVQLVNASHVQVARVAVALPQLAAGSASGARCRSSCSCSRANGVLPVVKGLSSTAAHPCETLRFAPNTADSRMWQRVPFASSP